MSVITTSDVPFTVPNLPILSMLNKDGMVVGIRPTQTTGILDVSDSHAELQLVGNPVTIEQGVRVSGNNYIRSPIQEPRNLTIMCGFRVRTDASPTSIQQVVGGLSGNASLSNGSGIYAGVLAGGSNPNYIGANYYTSKGPDGTRIVNTFAPGLTLRTPVAANVYTRWCWVAVAIDYDTMQASRYFSIEEGTLLKVDSTTLDPDGGLRTLNDIVFGMMEDGSGDTGWTFEIAEAFVYNRRYTEQEIGRQYQDSMGYMQGVNARIGT